jgi:thiol-disulfide isomerase/thioredoxin
MIYFDDFDPLFDEDDYKFGVLEPEDKKKLCNNPYFHYVESLIPKLEKLKKEFEIKFHEMIELHQIDVAPSH